MAQSNGEHGAIKFPVQIHGDCKTGLSDADGRILFEAIYAKHVAMPRAQKIICEAAHRLNDHKRLSDGYGVAVEALRVIMKNTKNFRPSDCEWPKSTAQNALKQLGELGETETPETLEP